jgi:predicted phage terminase large subunit-like protein
MEVTVLEISKSELIEAEREYCRRSLSGFVRLAWRVVEPTQEYIHGWHIDAICEHLEAVTRGEITRLWIAVPPGMMKSLTVGCFWPAWEWGPGGKPSYRYLGTSHSANLAIRDNARTLRLVKSEWYQDRWGKSVQLTSDAKTKFENTKTGFREAMAFTGLTGNRGDRVLMDDVLSVDDALSDAKRNAVKTTFLESVPTRLNNPRRSAIINIQQRLHEEDTIGLSIIRELGYEGLRLPMEFEADYRCTTSIGFKDPRKTEGELLFPERFPRETVDRDKRVMGSIATASQFQQRPVPREGGMFKRQWFEIVSHPPAYLTWVRGWDLAATEKSKGHKAPAYTAGVKIGMCPDGVIYIGHAIRGQLSAGKVESMIKAIAAFDGKTCTIDLPQDPGQAGKAQIKHLVKMLAGYNVVYSLESGSKELRAMPLAAQAEIGNVKLVAGEWNEDFIEEACTFPLGKFKDQIDAASRALARLTAPAINDMFAGPMVLGR